MSVLAFLSYVIVTSITPGPSNILMMNEARKMGFVGSWQFSSGILAGFAMLGIVSGVFTTGLYNLIPLVEPYFKITGAVYLLYLAWHVALDKGKNGNSSKIKSSFLSGFFFQIMNIKSILFFITVMSAFILPFYQSVNFIILYLALAIFVGWLALLLWSGFGSVFKKFFAKHDTSFRAIMSLMLVYSAISIFL
ncbi:lysine transporter LysE [Fictibacillus phosphorivorans]|uniref:Lysine transporter LysE n=1 Tax=Fictibacillus phosphorivorans TaxID=1221500 RepID=A0A160INL4_9BACL|nr:LysE family transporter [Fictibacillus phosphorivorans]ANC77480.1 lysine transporter LysE [Fictibacillus phosphorivorans]